MILNPALPETGVGVGWAEVAEQRNYTVPQTKTGDTMDVLLSVHWLQSNLMHCGAFCSVRDLMILVYLVSSFS